MKALRLLLAIGMTLGAWNLLNAQTYIGSAQCMICHNVVNPNLGYNIWVEQNKTGHPYKLNEVNGAPPVYPANTSPGVPFAPPADPDWNHYSHVIGGYGWKARFIQAADGNVFTSDSMAQYNLATQGWVPYEFGITKPYNYNCFKCHTTGPDPNGSWHPVTPGLGTFSEPGIRCEGCHGPGSAHMADPTNVSPPITADSLRYTRCGDCHQRGGTTNAIPASGGFIQHHEQFNEMKASKHGDGVAPDLQCGTCHDTHIALLYPQAAGAGLTAIRTECETCHPNHEILLNGQPKPIECEDCHMPHAGKSAIGTSAGNGWVGDVATHIWQINVAAVPRDSMFTANGSRVRLDADGHAAVTLDFVCLPCHQTRDIAWAAGWADDIHQNGLTGIEDVAVVPTQYELQQNFPNPFNPSTTISYVLPRSTRIRLAVYNVLGQEVAELLKGVQAPGSHQVQFNGNDLASGIYIYRLEYEKGVLSRKMILMK